MNRVQKNSLLTAGLRHMWRRPISPTGTSASPFAPRGNLVGSNSGKLVGGLRPRPGAWTGHPRPGGWAGRPRGLSAYSVEESNLGGLDNWFTDTLKVVVPSHTIVGKWVNGDTAGAAQDAAKFAQGAIRPQQTRPSYNLPANYGAGASGGSSSTLLWVGGGLAAALIALRLFRR